MRSFPNERPIGQRDGGSDPATTEGAVFMTEKLKDKSTRRDFLKLASTTAPAALAATALSTTQVAADVAEPALDKMQDTEHTRAYYDSLSF